MITLHRPAPLAALLLLLFFVAACSNDDPPPGAAAPPATTGATPPPELALDPAPAVVLPAPFHNDPQLAAFAAQDRLGLPTRFRLVDRDDREPILSLGLVDAAARLTYSATLSAEILSLDLLRLQLGVDPDDFFTDFADTVADDRDFIGLSALGIPRGAGDAARHYAFNIQNDEGQAFILLRDGLLVFLTYRHPPNLRDPLDVAALMGDLDARLREDPPGGG